MPPYRRFRDNDTGEVYKMPWSSQEEPTPSDYATFVQQKRQHDNSWTGMAENAASKAVDWASGAVSRGNALAMQGSENLHPVEDLTSAAQGIGDTLLGLGKMAITPIAQQGQDIANQWMLNQMDRQQRGTDSPLATGWDMAKAASPVPIDPLVDVAQGIGYGTGMTDSPISPHQVAHSVGELGAMAGLMALHPSATEERAPVIDDQGGPPPPSPPVAEAPPPVADPNAPPPPPAPPGGINIAGLGEEPALNPIKRAEQIQPDIVQDQNIHPEPPPDPSFDPAGQAPIPDVQPPSGMQSAGGPELAQGFADSVQPPEVPPVEDPNHWSNQQMAVPDVNDPMAIQDSMDQGRANAQQRGQNIQDQILNPPPPEGTPAAVPPMEPPVPEQAPPMAAAPPDVANPAGPSLMDAAREAAAKAGVKVPEAPAPKAVPKGLQALLTRAQELGIDVTNINNKKGLTNAIAEAEARAAAPPPEAAEVAAEQQRVNEGGDLTDPNAPPDPEEAANAAHMQELLGQLEASLNPNKATDIPAGPRGGRIGAMDVPDLSNPEAPPVQEAPPAPKPTRAAPAEKPSVRTVTDTKGNTRVWINDVEFTDRFGPGGPTMAEVTRLERQVADPASFKRLAELKGEKYVGMAEPQPTAPEPASLPKPKGATPDRVLRIGRGAHDPVRVTFPDALHADLFSAIGRMRKAVSGEKAGIPPQFDRLAKAFGVSEKDIGRIAQAYRDKVMAQVKGVPKTVEGGLAEMDAPGLHETESPTSVAPETSAEAVTAKMKAKTAKAVAAIEKQKQAAVKELADKLNTPKTTEVLPGVKDMPPKVKMQALLDDLSQMSADDVKALAKDKGALYKFAKDRGMKLGAVKQVIAAHLGDSKVGGDVGALSLPTKQQMITAGQKAFEIGNELRMTSFLSGLALPKSLIGDVGAHLTASLEGLTLKPIRALFNIKQIASDMQSGWRRSVNPAQTSGIGKINLPGRAMGAGDYAALESLKRAGISEADAKEILLTNANALSSWKALQSGPGKFMFPFVRISANVLEQGLTRWRKYPAVYAGAVVLGALAGGKIKDKEALAMAAAFAGPYALPFLMGAGLAQGSMKTLDSASPLPEWGITKTMSNPFAAFTDSPGKRWLRSNLGFGQQAAWEKQMENPPPMGTGGSGRGRGSRGRSSR